MLDLFTADKPWQKFQAWLGRCGCFGGGGVTWFRLRIGDYRVRFRVQAESVIVDKQGGSLTQRRKAAKRGCYNGCL
jgi:hypothetical protein